VTKESTSKESAPKGKEKRRFPDRKVQASVPMAPSLIIGFGDFIPAFMLQQVVFSKEEDHREG
jgi:hypothetical protein